MDNGRQRGKDVRDRSAAHLHITACLEELSLLMTWRYYLVQVLTVLVCTLRKVRAPKYPPHLCIIFVLASEPFIDTHESPL